MIVILSLEVMVFSLPLHAHTSKWDQIMAEYVLSFQICCTLLLLNSDSRLSSNLAGI